MRTQDLLSLSQAANSLPHRPAPSTVWRWIRKGVPVNGRRFYLPCKRIGGRIFVDPDELHSFVDALTEADRQAHAPQDREADIEAAERRVMGRE